MRARKARDFLSCWGKPGGSGRERKRGQDKNHPQYCVFFHYIFSRASAGKKRPESPHRIRPTTATAMICAAAPHSHLGYIRGWRKTYLVVRHINIAIFQGVR